MGACASLSAAAQDSGPRRVQFDGSTFPGSRLVDLSRFESGNVVFPGSYVADVVVNGESLGNLELMFQDVNGTTQLCVSSELMEQLGVDIERLRGADVAADAEPAEGDAAATLAEGNDNACRSLEERIEGATATFDAGELRLAVQIPQLFMRRDARGSVPVSRLDRGINAGILQYYANVHRDSGVGRPSTSGFVGLRGGLNLGDWQLRHSGSLSWHERTGSSYRPTDTYARRDIDPLRAQLYIGQLHNRGDLFDSVRLMGVELASDDRMLPQSELGYAPVVQGVAETNALVRVMQRGVVLREVTVAPGPFLIDDLNSIGNGGDLTVVIREADGRERSFDMPVSGNTFMLRPGRTRFSISAGRVDAPRIDYTPTLVQAQIQRGLSNTLTGSAGAQVSDHYKAAQLGAAINTAIGVVALDLTQANVRLRNQSLSGQSVRLRVTKQIEKTGTGFNVGAYRYSTDGFVDLYQALQLRDADVGEEPNRGIDRQRSRVEATINQRFGARGGSLYATTARLDYWNRRDSTLSYTLGYSNHWRGVGYNLNMQRTTRLDDGATDNEVNVSVNVPLGRAPRSPSLRASLRRDRTGHLSGSTHVRGTLDEVNALSYGFGASRSSGETSLSGNLQYRNRFGNLGASASRGDGYSNISLDAEGAMVVHGRGITFGPSANDSMALMYAPGARGARVTSGDGARIDRRGFALMPALTPYRYNTVELDPRGLPEDVELKATSRVVAPRSGAVVAIDLPTETGRTVLIRARQQDGRTLPFSAAVYDEAGSVVGSVGQGSRLQVRSESQQGVLTVRWGKAEDQQCEVPFRLPESSAGTRTAAVINDAVCETSRHVAARMPAPELAVVAPPADPWQQLLQSRPSRQVQRLDAAPWLP